MSSKCFVIHRVDLLVLDACPRELGRFDRYFPSGSVKLTKANCIKDGPMFSLNWIASRLFKQRAAKAWCRLSSAAIRQEDRTRAVSYRKFNKAWRDSHLVLALAETAAQKKLGITGPVWCGPAAYQKLVAPVQRAHEQRCRELRRAHLKEKALAAKVRSRAYALAFYNASKVGL